MDLSSSEEVSGPLFRSRTPGLCYLDARFLCFRLRRSFSSFMEKELNKWRIRSCLPEVTVGDLLLLQAIDVICGDYKVRDTRFQEDAPRSSTTMMSNWLLSFVRAGLSDMDCEEDNDSRVDTLPEAALDGVVLWCFPLELMELKDQIQHEARGLEGAVR